MPRKAKEVEEQIDISTQPQKKDTFAARWFKDHAVNNATELKQVCDLTAESVEEQFKLCVPSHNTEIFAVVFYATFITILDFLKSKEKNYDRFAILIANSINIGYTNNDDDDSEKVGNFMPILEYRSINRSLVDSSSTGFYTGNCENGKKDSAATVRDITNRYIEWQDKNMKECAGYFNEIAQKAAHYLYSEFRINLRTHQAVFPLFCIFMDYIVAVLKQKFLELQGTDVSEVSMNVLGLFDAYYSYNEEDGQEVIELSPLIATKLRLKEDSIASRE